MHIQVTRQSIVQVSSRSTSDYGEGDRQSYQQTLIAQTQNKGQECGGYESAVVLHLQQNDTAVCKQ